MLDCGLVAHRTCAATGLPSCLATVERPLGIQFKSIFGHGLCVLFNPDESPAPAVVSTLHTHTHTNITCFFYFYYCLDRTVYTRVRGQSKE